MTAPTRILVVDDDAAFAAAIARMLKPHTAVVVASAKIALDHAMAERFDLVISDVRMWPIDGLELAADLHRLGLPVRVVFVTNANIDDVRAMVSDLGLPNVAEVLAKPVTQDDLDLAVGHALSAARSRRRSDNPRAATAPGRDRT